MTQGCWHRRAGITRSKRRMIRSPSKDRVRGYGWDTVTKGIASEGQNCVCPKSLSLYAVYVHGNGMYQKLLMKLIESLSSWSLSRARCTGDWCEAEPKRHKTDP